MLEKLYAKYTKKKVYLGAAILLIIINIITMFMAYKANTSFTIDNQKIRYVSDRRDTVLFKDNEDDEVNITIEDGKNPTMLDIIANKYKVTYKDKTIEADFSNWFDNEVIITKSNGRERNLTISEYLSYSRNKYGPFDESLIYNMNETYSIAKDKSFIFGMIFIIFPLIFLGLAGIMYPEKLWRFEHFFTVQGGEPTEWAIFSSKLAGIIIIVFVLLIPFIM